MNISRPGKIFYNKLVRDKIRNKIKSAGEECEVREITDDQEFQQELLKKVVEESSALAHVRSRDEFLSEYSDLMVVLDTLISHLELSEADIKTVLEENLKKKGKYEKRHFLHWSEDSGYTSNETPQGIKAK